MVLSVKKIANKVIRQKFTISFKFMKIGRFLTTHHVLKQQAITVTKPYEFILKPYISNSKEYTYFSLFTNMEYSISIDIKI